MALGFWRNRGEQRRRISRWKTAYHGDTIGGMSVGARGVFNAPYEPLLFDVERIPFPTEGRSRPRWMRSTMACRDARRRGADRRAADPRCRRHADLSGLNSARR